MNVLDMWMGCELEFVGDDQAENMSFLVKGDVYIPFFKLLIWLMCFIS